MKKLLLLSLFFLKVSVSNAQFGLYNTRTLYDTFENPSQKAFYPDSSRKYAFNFFIPTINIHANVSGEAQKPFKTLIYKGGLDASGLSLGSGELNKITVSENSYLAMFRIFKTVKFNREIGLAWQIRSDMYGEITNETAAIFDNYRLFTQRFYENPFNNNAFSLGYHQFSITYREDYNKRLGLGVKLSYLSGIEHTKFKIDSSHLGLNSETDAYSLSLHGKFRSNISWDQADKKVLYPGFKNPGVALSLSANYKLRNGWYILGNLKDLGFIRWNKNDGYTYTFDDVITINSASAPDADDRLGSEIQKLFDRGSSEHSYTTLINGKAEFLVNKDLGNYQPNLLISKNLFYKGGDIALINRLRHRAMNFSLSTAYNLNNFFQLGGQFMIKSPNTEFFIGSDQLLKSYYTTKGILTSNQDIGKGNTAASVYFGFALKFGRIMERQQNANFIPGLDTEVRPSFFQRLFSKKK